MRRGAILFLLGAAACIGSPARGSTITYSADAADDLVLVVSSGGTKTSASYLFIKDLTEFDPALGALTQVNLSMSAEGIAAFEIGSTGGGGKASLGPGPSPDDGDLTVFGVGPGGGIYTYGNAAGEVSAGSPVSHTFFLPLSITNSVTLTTPELVSMFNGPGVFGWKWEPTASVTATGPDTTAALKLVSYHAAVTYTYTAVPEPSSAGLAALGALSLLVFRARRRARSRATGRAGGAVEF